MILSVVPRARQAKGWSWLHGTNPPHARVQKKKTKIAATVTSHLDT